MNITELFNKVHGNENIPSHIAIIMDGNGRWAQTKSKSRLSGHREGIKSVRAVTRVCGDLGVKHLTLYTFSTENWLRPKKEVSALMTLLMTTIRGEIKDLHKNNIRVTTIGRLEDLPESARKSMEDGRKLTKNNTGLNLNLALSYGSRQEIVRAVKSISQDSVAGKISVDQIDENLLSSKLNTADMPDPDLLIRTGDEKRLSNFLLWQVAYAELYLSPVFWPDFRKKELLEAVMEYQARERRFGKISSQISENK